MTTITDLLKKGTEKLKASGSSSVSLDVGLLLSRASGVTRLEMLSHPEREIPVDQVQVFDELLERRATHEPMAYILGAKEFWGLDFHVEPGILIPRPDTETLIATLVALIGNPEQEATVVDVGIGSGAILISLLTEFKNFEGIAIDISDKALDISKKNAEKHHVASRITWLKGNYLDPLEEQVDMIVSNPPYIRSDVMATLMPDVKDYEPSEALDGGDSGLDAYKAIIGTGYAKLKPGGVMALEIGYDQKEDVDQLLKAHPWRAIEHFKDLSGHDRVVVALKDEEE